MSSVAGTRHASSDAKSRKLMCDRPEWSVTLELRSEKQDEASVGHRRVFDASLSFYFRVNKGTLAKKQRCHPCALRVSCSGGREHHLPG